MNSIMTYAQASLAISRGRNGRKRLGNNTYLVNTDDGPAVKIHGTSVVTINSDGTYTLDSGGYRTATTKDRINEHSPARVSQENFVWYLYPNGYQDKDSRVLFEDGMRVDATGSLVCEAVK